MKRKICLAVGALLLFSAAALAQSVVVTPRKVTYRRPKPSMDFKKTFTITYPKVKAATPALSRKIENTLSYQKNLNLNLKEELGEYQWLEEADFEVVYNARNILGVKLWMSGSAAYPSGVVKTVVVDLRSGSRIRPADIFVDLNGLAAKLKEMQRAEMRRAREEYKKDTESADFDPAEYFDRADFTIKELAEFSIGENGVTFNYEYGFPHVVQALEPDGEYFLDWTTLAPFIRRDGLLAPFVR